MNGLLERRKVEEMLLHVQETNKRRREFKKGE